MAKNVDKTSNVAGRREGILPGSNLTPTERLRPANTNRLAIKYIKLTLNI